jgi:hypothetical protein
MINISSTYFGFTDSKKPMTATRMKNTLDKQFRYDEGIMSQKSYVYLKLSKGCIPSKQENYSYYSARIDDYTKPKTLYTIESKENGTYNEINKTVYDFAMYLINKDFLNEEKAQHFIEDEIEQKEAEEHARKEQEEREREERERLELAEKERENAERKEKTEKWEAIGKQLMTDNIKKYIETLINKNWSELEPMYQLEKSAFTDQYINHWLKYFGNELYIDSKFKYYIEQENDSDMTVATVKTNPMQFLEKSILFHIFSNVSLSDKYITISAKIKAFYNNREYKGAAQSKIYKFYWMNGQTRQFTETYGQKIIIEKRTFYIRFDEQTKKYYIIEPKSGFSVASSINQKDAIQEGKKMVNRYIEKLDNLIESSIKNHGLSPLFQEKELILN